MQEENKLQNTVDIDGVKVSLQELDNITDHRTMGDIEEDEKAQCDQMHRELKEYEYDLLSDARGFISECIIHSLERLGCEIDRDIGRNWKTQGFDIIIFLLQNKEAAKILYASKKVRVSYHRKSQEDEFWKSGLYIYKDKELIAFISKPERMRNEIRLKPEFWMVRTNVKLPGGKGILFH